MTTCQGRGCHNLLKPSVGSRPRQWCSEQCRKTKYSVPCIDCGTPLNGSDGRGPNSALRCVPCANAIKAAKSMIWSQETIAHAMRRWAAEYGEPPAVPDWSPNHARALGDEARARRFEDAAGRWPWFTHAVLRFGSWNAAIAAAGFEPRRADGGGGNVARRRSVRAKALK